MAEKRLRVFTFTSGKIIVDSITAKNTQRNDKEVSSLLPALPGEPVVVLQEHGGHSIGGHGEPSAMRALRFSNVKSVSRGLMDEVLEKKKKMKQLKGS